MTDKFEVREVLRIKRIFSAPRERVFDAWIKAEMLARWFGPEGFSVVHVEAHPYVGGSYNIEICSPDGQLIRHFGDYIEVSRPDKLIFTWMLENQACQGSENLCAETLVSIEFSAVDQGTEITLSHEQLPDKRALDGHKFGWNSSLVSLTRFLETAE